MPPPASTHKKADSKATRVSALLIHLGSSLEWGTSVIFLAESVIFKRTNLDAGEFEPMGNRYLDWFRQAEADLRHAKHALQAGDFEWSCFASQQAAEKAIKALFQKQGMEAWGHTVTILIGNLPENVTASEELIRNAKMLDKHYILTRYPNGFDSGAPTDFYTSEEAQTAIRAAEEIVEFCRNQVS